MRRLFSLTLLLALLLIPASASAQSIMQLSQPHAGPWRASPALFTSDGQSNPAESSVHATLAPAATGALAMGEGGSRKQGVTLMIVGAAGILTGILIDESVVTIAGAVVAGVGLYFYLK